MYFINFKGLINLYMYMAVDYMYMYMYVFDLWQFELCIITSCIITCISLLLIN